MADETTEEFATRLMEIYSGGMAMLSLSVGYRTGLLDKMLTYDEPKTCAEVARDTGLKERYVREWMLVTTSAKITNLQRENDEDKFIIPKHRRPAFSPSNLADCLPLLARVTEELANCFKKDGPPGIGYESYNGYFEWNDVLMRSQFKIDRVMKFLKGAPGLMEALESGISFCEIGCATGFTTCLLAEKFPKSEFYGLDIDEGAIQLAKKYATNKSLPNCHFIATDATNMPPEWTEKWDCIQLFDVLHDMSHATKALSEFRRTLKTGGYLSVVEMNLHSDVTKNLDDPKAPFVYTFSLFFCVPASLSEEGGEGWGGAWGWEKAVEIIKASGFRDIKVVSLGEKVWNIGMIAKK